MTDNSVSRSACRKFKFALAIGVSLALASVAQAETKPHKERCSGTIHVSEMISPTVAKQEATGEGNATHMGKYTETFAHKVDLAAGTIFDGVFVSTAADGSTAYGTYSGTFAINPNGTVSYEVTPIWLGGTGRFEGLFGIGSVTALATGVAPVSTFKFVTDAIWNLP